MYSAMKTVSYGIVRYIIYHNSCLSYVYEIVLQLCQLQNHWLLYVEWKLWLWLNWEYPQCPHYNGLLLLVAAYIPLSLALMSLKQLRHLSFPISSGWLYDDNLRPRAIEVWNQHTRLWWLNGCSTPYPEFFLHSQMISWYDSQLPVPSKVFWIKTKHYPLDGFDISCNGGTLPRAGECQFNIVGLPRALDH